MRDGDPGHKKRKEFVFFRVFLCSTKICRCMLEAGCLDGCCFDVYGFFVDLDEETWLDEEVKFFWVDSHKLRRIV